MKQTLIFDYHGTLGDDIEIYYGILDQLKRLKEFYKLIIFSNATFLSKDVEISYLKKGLIKGIHFDEVITSGQIFYDNLMQNNKFFKVFEKDGLFKDYKDLLVDDINSANFIYISIPDLANNQPVFLKDLRFNGNNISIDEIIQFDLFDKLKIENEAYKILVNEVDNAIMQNKNELYFVIANPDLTAEVDKNLALRQGFIGAYLKFKKQKIIFFGKPIYSSIEYVLKKYQIDSSKATFFGDLIYTDILSANFFKIDAVLCGNKNINQFFFKKSLSNMNISFEEELKYLKVENLSDYLLKIKS